MFLIFPMIFVAGLTVFLLLGWMVGRKSCKEIMGIMWLCIAGIVAVRLMIHVFTGKKNVAHEDAYGEYIIDRTMFPGKQADWQYNHFRFEIKENGRFLFYQTENERVIKKCEGDVSFHPSYSSPRLIINMDSTTHHIIEPEPTLHRSTWSFYYTFNSPLWGNVYFKKGKWNPIN